MLCATFVNSKNIHLPNLMSSILQQLHLISNLTYSKDKRLGTHIDISTSSGFNLILLRRLSISDFPFQWHLFDQKVILLKILYQQGFKNVFTSQTSGPLPTVPKLGRQIFGTVGDGPEVRMRWKLDHQFENCPKFFEEKIPHWSTKNVAKKRSVANEPSDR